MRKAPQAFALTRPPGRFLNKPYEGASRPILVWLTPNVCAMTVRAQQSVSACRLAS
jgi:hypothetical protein